MPSCGLMVQWLQVGRGTGKGLCLDPSLPPGWSSPCCKHTPGLILSNTSTPKSSQGLAERCFRVGFGRAQAEEGEGAHGWGCPPSSVPLQSILYFCRNPNSLERRNFYLYQSVMEASQGLTLMILSLGGKMSTSEVLIVSVLSWECELQIQS